MLHTEPSFCIYSNEDDEAEKESYIQENLERSNTVGESLDRQFSFARNNSMEVVKEDDDEHKDRVMSRFADLKTDNHSDDDVHTYYRQMLYECPNDSLILRDYAQFLESKNDFSGAEEYYHGAVLADPKDGPTHSRLAKLLWEKRSDKAKASAYFERSILAAPNDSDVLAAYAKFLWEADENGQDDEEEDDQNISKPKFLQLHMSEKWHVDEFEKEEERPKSPPLHLALGLGIGPTFHNAIDSYIGDDEEDFKRMVEENPCNPQLLRNYAQFLHKSKGDVKGAEEYYSRAILTDPSDGESLSLYAQLIWEFHRDKDRASVYYQQAAMASPENSDVLAAYAKFLWETEDDE